MFDAIGLGVGSPWGYTPQFPLNNNPQAMVNTPFYPLGVPLETRLHTCIHTNCPLCKKEFESRAEQIKLETSIVVHKKELYEKQCKKYMKRFRRTYL